MPEQTPPKPPHTLKSFADFMWLLRRRCTNRDGKLASSAWVHLCSEDIEAIVALQERLDQMEPHAQAIRKVVTGR